MQSILLFLIFFLDKLILYSQNKKKNLYLYLRIEIHNFYEII